MHVPKEAKFPFNLPPSIISEQKEVLLVRGRLLARVCLLTIERQRPDQPRQTGGRLQMGKTTNFSASAESVADAHDYRDYQKAPKHVRRNYKLNHTNQYYDWAKEQKEKYSRCDSGLEMSIW